MCVAPTALGSQRIGFPALPGWANFFRASGARPRSYRLSRLRRLEKARSPKLRVGRKAAPYGAVSPSMCAGHGMPRPYRKASRRHVESVPRRSAERPFATALQASDCPCQKTAIQMSKSVRLSSRERTRLLVTGRLAESRTRVYCPLVQRSCYLYFFDLPTGPAAIATGASRLLLLFLEHALVPDTRALLGPRPICNACLLPESPCRLP